jgi:hypothetical protein
VFRTIALLVVICAAVVSVLSTASAGNEGDGPAYSTEQLANFDLGGLKLGMTAKDAETVMKAAGYEGVFDAQIGERVKGWRQVDRAIFPFRYVAKDGQIRIWYIQFQQQFDVNMSEDTIKEKVIAKYGPPSRIENNEFIYESAWPVGRISAGNCLSLGENYCKMGMVRDNPYKSYSELRAGYDAAANRPQLRIEIKPKQVVAHFEHRGAKEEADTYQKLQARNAEEEKRRKATKKLDLGL